MSVRVSDRALLRFLERCGGLDAEQLRGDIERSLAVAVDAATSIGATEYLILADGLSYVVRDGVVRTITDGRGRESQARTLGPS